MLHDRYDFKTVHTTPEAVETAKACVWQTLHAIEHYKDAYQEAKQEALAAFSRADSSGYDLLDRVMDHLGTYQRLIPFSEEMQEIECISFRHVVALAQALTPERHVCFLMLP